MTIITVPRLDDATVMNLFQEISGKFHPQSCFLRSALFEQPINISQGQPEDLISSVNVANSFVLNSGNADFNRFRVQYHRGGRSKQPPIAPWFDEFEFDNNGPASNPPFSDESRIALYKLIQGYVGPAADARLAEPQERFGLTDIEALYRSTVLKLETNFANQLETLTSWAVRQADDFEKRKIALADETAAEREKLRAEFEKREAALKSEAEALEARRREIDDRDYMHARRAIRGDLQKMLHERQQKFELTQGTRKLRAPIHAAMLGLIGFLVTFNGLLLYRLSQQNFAVADAVLVWALIKQGLAAAILVGAVLYYVRWMNRWFEDHAKAEFLLKNFQLDIDRASWAVETALEWRRIEQSEIPQPLLEGITRNLFSTRDVAAERLTAADDLASALVGNASAVKMKVGRNELSFDRKGIKALSKSDAGSE